MTDALTNFVRHAAGRSFEWGRWDCALVCAEWVLVRRGVDAAAKWRGHYHTALGQMRIVTRQGGMLALFDRSLSPLGICRTVDPRRGDIAVVGSDQGDTGAIVLGVSNVLLVAVEGISIRHRSIAPLRAAWML